MRHFKIIAAILIMVSLTSNASAVIFGIRFSNVNEPLLLPAIENAQKGDRFGVYIGENQKNHDFLFGVDFDSYKLEKPDTLLYSRRLVVDIGYRYRLFSGAKIEGTNVLPFFAVHYYRSFGKIKADDSVMSPADRAFYKDFASDQGGWFSVGAEYYFAPLFGFGCEGGIRYSKAKSNAYGYDIKISEYKTFAAILITFRL